MKKIGVVLFTIAIISIFALLELHYQRGWKLLMMTDMELISDLGGIRLYFDGEKVVVKGE